MERSSPGRAGKVWRAEHTDGVALEPRNVDECVDIVRCLLVNRRLLALHRKESKNDGTDTCLIIYI